MGSIYSSIRNPLPDRDSRFRGEGQARRAQRIFAAGWSAALCALLWSVLPARPAAAQIPQTEGKPAEVNLAVGREAYLANCARCHGPTGAGDGRDAEKMVPRPRPLSEGIFKFRTTESGTPPSDDDLFHTITEGLQGSRMPGFERLLEPTRWQIVYYIKSLSPVFDEIEPVPVDLGIDPGAAGADLEAGRQVYEKLGCAACHGDRGRGNGPSAPALTDEWGNPIRAADLTQPWTYRAGSSPKAILTRLLTGLDGTPMPSYTGAVSAEEAWQLAYYVHSLQEEPRWRDSVEVARVEGTLPDRPDDPRWESVPRSDLRMSSVYYKEGKVAPTFLSALSVQAVYNEEGIAFRLSWHDRSESRQELPDAAAVALLGDPKLKWSTGSVRAWPAGPEAPALDLLYWSSSMEQARQAVAKEILPAEEADAQGEPRPAGAWYTDGLWTLILQRPLAASREEGGRGGLVPDRRTAAGFMIWDGDNGETGRHRSNSRWVDLVLK